jgi:hypothetical protein
MKRSWRDAVGVSDDARPPATDAARVSNDTSPPATDVARPATDAAVLARAEKLPWVVSRHASTLDGQRYVGVAAYSCSEHGEHTRCVDPDTGELVWYVGRHTWRTTGDTAGGGVRWFTHDPDIPGVYHEEEGTQTHGTFAWHSTKTPLFPLYGVKTMSGKGGRSGTVEFIVLPKPVRDLAAEFVVASTLVKGPQKPRLAVPGWTFWDTPLVSAASWLLAAAPPVHRGPGLNYKVFAKRECKAKAAVNNAIRLVVGAAFGDRAPAAAAVLDTRDLYTTKAVGAVCTWAPNISRDEATAMVRAARPARHKRDAKLGDVRVVCMALGTFLKHYTAADHAPLEVLCADYTSNFDTFAAKDLHYAATTPGVLASKAIVTVTASVRNAKAPGKAAGTAATVTAPVHDGIMEHLGRTKTAVVVQFYDVFARAGWDVAVKAVVNYGSMVFVAAEMNRHK